MSAVQPSIPSLEGPRREAAADRPERDRLLAGAYLKASSIAGPSARGLADELESALFALGIRPFRPAAHDPYSARLHEIDAGGFAPDATNETAA